MTTHCRERGEESHRQTKGVWLLPHIDGIGGKYADVGLVSRLYSEMAQSCTKIHSPSFNLDVEGIEREGERGLGAGADMVCLQKCMR